MSKFDEKQKKLIFNHGWKYFELHANQRISLFRFYIIFFGFYAAGIGFLIARCDLPTNLEKIFICLVSILFILITFIFWRIDLRNQKLIDLAKTSLCAYENDHFDKEKGEHRIFNAQRITNDLCPYDCCLCYYSTHSRCYRLLFKIAILCAIGLIVYGIFFHESQCPQPSPCSLGTHSITCYFQPLPKK